MSAEAADEVLAIYRARIDEGSATFEADGQSAAGRMTGPHP
ncbi:hypothetical protein [Streptomyces sp. NL15-2K]|nr:hypothetical protein [Streptomyces sp. NL15-2K]GCB43220.1 hypothetical protein SNL152K_505 [Streptomyces sp. NL15-2K]